MDLRELVSQRVLSKDRVLHILGDARVDWLLATHQSLEERVGGDLGLGLGGKGLGEDHSLLDVELVVLLVHAFYFVLLAADLGFQSGDLKVKANLPLLSGPGFPSPTRRLGPSWCPALPASSGGTSGRSCGSAAAASRASRTPSCRASCRFKTRDCSVTRLLPRSLVRLLSMRIRVRSPC